LNKTAQATIAKLCLSAAAAFIVGGALRIEQGDRAFETPELSEVTNLGSAGACPENDSVPYGSRCLVYLKGSDDAGIAWQFDIVTSAAAVPPAPSGQACPDNDNVPYSARCLVFLKGATELGMRWRVNADPVPPLPLAIRD